MMRPGRWTLAFLGAALMGCFSGNGPQEDTGEPGEKLALWQSKRPPRYAYTLSRGCFCPRTYVGPFLVEAEGEAVTRVRRIEDEDTLAVDGDLQAYSIQALFQAVEDRIAHHNHREDVEYHPNYGFPISASFDGSASIADDEFDFSVTDFRKL